jgi:hypothetical protein
MAKWKEPGSVNVQKGVWREEEDEVLRAAYTLAGGSKRIMHTVSKIIVFLFNLEPSSNKAKPNKRSSQQKT